MTTAGRMAQNCGQVRLHKPPSSQNVISGSWLKGSATYFSTPKPAENKADTAMPARINRSTQPPNRTRRAMRYESPRPKKANEAAEICTAQAAWVKKIMLKAAPKEAPWETPKKPGSTRGLPKII